MSVSVTTPISQAWDRMTLVCFKPFDISRWFIIGFAVFLSQLGQGGGSYITNIPSQGTGGGSGTAQSIADIIAWIEQNMAMVVSITAALILISTCLAAVIYWLQCRGIFMFIDGMAKNEAAVKAPWKQYADLSNSAWRFKMWTFLLMGLISMGTSVGCLAWAWADMRAGIFGPDAAMAMMVWVLVIVPFALFYWKAQIILADFIAPMMYAQNLSAGRAWMAWFRRFLKGHVWAIVLFYLMRLVFSMAAGSIGFVACCLTCSIAMWPYLSAVFLLPIHAFNRCYSMYFVQQFGEEWAMFVRIEETPLCPGCRYDLRGNPEASTCPECGYTLQPVVATPHPGEFMGPAAG